jgi:hypothetical protein
MHDKKVMGHAALRSDLRSQVLNTSTELEQRSAMMALECRFASRTYLC